MIQNFYKNHLKRWAKDAFSIFWVMWVLFATWGGVCYAGQQLADMGAIWTAVIFLFYLVIALYIHISIIKRG